MHNYLWLKYVIDQHKLVRVQWRSNNQVTKVNIMVDNYSLYLLDSIPIQSSLKNK